MFSNILTSVMICVVGILLIENPDLTVPATASWDAPLYGTPVVKYTVEHSIDNGAWYTYALTDTNTSIPMSVSFWSTHRIRVAGIDAEDRVGAFSDPSPVYAPADSMPHPPSKPVRQ